LQEVYYLGDAYLHHTKGDPAQNIEEAIKHYKQALGVRRRNVESIPWAETMINFGEALRRRIGEDRTINLDQAVYVLEQSIEILQDSNKIDLLVSAHINLGTVWLERITGSPENNLNRSIEQFKLALKKIEMIDPSSPIYNQIFVMANGNLGYLYWKKARVDLWDYSALLKKAENHFRLALDRIGTETSPLVQAHLHSGLGLVLSDRIHGGSELHEEAIRHLEMAISLLETEKSISVSDLGQTYHNLATIYRERKVGDRQTNIQSAESCFLKALDTFSIKDFPVHRRDTLRAFGMMYFEEEDWKQASTYFQEAIQISEEILGGCYTEPGKEAEVTQNRNLYSHTVYCLLKLKQFDRALVTLEQGKARMLNEVLGWKDLDVSTLSEEQQQALQWARNEIVRLEAENRNPQVFPESGQKARLGRQLADAYRHLEKLRREVSSGSIEEIDLRTILNEIPTNGALIAPIVTPKGGAAFVLPDGIDSLAEEHIVSLDFLTTSVLGELMAGKAGSGGWLNTYKDWVEGAIKSEDLQEGLNDLMSRLWDILIGPIYKRLKKFGVIEQAPVIIVPSGWLGLFPLHAAFGIIDGEQQTFGEYFTVSYAPSVRILGICRQRLTQPQRQGKKLLAVANPTGDLKVAEAKCKDIRDLFVQQQHSSEAAILLSGSEELRSQIVQNLKQTNYHHFSCHGIFNWMNPAESGLKLAADDLLILADILSSDVDLSTSRLVTLSACETGWTEFQNMPDEFIGLAGAFLEGGTPAVVSTLWRVEEVSTQLLMTEFYRLHLEEKKGVAAALRAAQMWLKTSSASQIGLAAEYEDNPDEIPFGHPFYWAAFTVTGIYL
jgi:CHAT domain-containing protein/tetratricopeptide (TPR) repeat protein